MWLQIQSSIPTYYSHQLWTVTSGQKKAYVQDSDTSFEELPDVKPSLVRGVQSQVEGVTDRVGARCEFANRLVDSKLLPHLGQVKVGSNLVAFIGQLDVLDASRETTLRL